MDARDPLTPTARTEPVPHRFPAWGVDVFESHHADGWRMDHATHGFLKVVFVLQGRGALITDGDPVECGAGQALVVHAGTAHRLEDRPDSPMSVYVVSVEGRLLAAADLDPARLPAGVLSLSPAESARVERSMRRLLFEQTLAEPTTGPSMVALALHLLVDLMRIGAASRDASSSTPHPPAARPAASLAQVEAYAADLAHHFFEATSLDAAASSLGLSRRRFTQLFREATGTSWLAYLRRLRIEHARRLLATNRRTVLSTAFECGFDDMSAFYRAFKRETGSSPNDWRERHRTGRARP